MNLFKKIEKQEVTVELVPIQCQCGIQIKMDKRVIEKGEAIVCPNCQKIGFIQ